MRYSSLLGRTLRDVPSDADHVAHQLVLRAGLARPLLAGGAALMPLGMLVARHIEAIMHVEMARIAGQEFRTPVVQSASLWEQTGRYAEYGPQMLRFQNRAEQNLIVAPTHEEAVAELARREVESYRQMPALLYQIHTKYRDELRVRGGLLRLREFTMLDAYSLDTDFAALDTMYDRLAGAFERIFERCGVRFVAVEAGTGEMGGREAREYMALSSAGEDTLAICAGCGYAANLEVASAKTGAIQPAAAESQAPTELVATPDCTTIAELAALLGIAAADTAKAVFFDTPEHGLLFVVIRGDREVNELKLRAAAGVSDLQPATLEQIAAVGAVAGYASPVGLDNVTILADHSVVAGGLVAGANQPGFHLRNVRYGRDWTATTVADIASVQAGDRCERCGSALTLERGIEIGHIFKLGTRYTSALGATYLDAAGASQPIVMGSYGIGVERLLQVIVEQHHDAAGIIWPPTIAPAAVHLVRLGAGDAVLAAADDLYAALQAAGLTTLYDDRAETAGVKFNDADLIGLPLRLVISERGLKSGTIEIKQRGSGAVEHVPLDHQQIVALLKTQV